MRITITFTKKTQPAAFGAQGCITGGFARSWSEAASMMQKGTGDLRIVRTGKTLCEIWG